MNTSEKIKQYRLKKGLSQEELGKLVGLQKAAINKYETGRVVNIKKSVLQKLAEALSVSPADLLDDNTSNISYVLSPDESALLDDYQKLNAAGRNKVREYASDLTEQKKYTEDTGSLDQMSS